ncbi:MAG: hypothetical protein MK317_04350 [Pseudomonadales bacterium]|nr:hypothetical protein [Pseudomonadales bacterium]
MIRKLFILIFVSMTSYSIVAQSSANGVWNFSMASPMGSVSATVTMMVEGSLLRGEFDLGGGRTWPIEEGAVDGNKISFNINRDGSSMTYVMSAEVNGDSISGVAAAMGTTAEWSMTRAE